MPEKINWNVAVFQAARVQADSLPEDLKGWRVVAVKNIVDQYDEERIFSNALKETQQQAV